MPEVGGEVPLHLLLLLSTSYYVKGREGTVFVYQHTEHGTTVQGIQNIITGAIRTHPAIWVRWATLLIYGRPFVVCSSKEKKKKK